MSDENKVHQPSVSLREFFEQRMNGLEESIRVYHIAMDSRLHAMNEFRDSLKDQSAKMRTREECVGLMDRVTEDVKALRESKAMLEGKASQSSVNITMAISVLSLGLSAVSAVMVAIHLLMKGSMQ
jgi:hypothetical protein